MTIEATQAATIDVFVDTTDDHSGSFRLVRRHIKNSENVSLVEYVRTLKPKYHVVMRDIALGYALLLGSALVAAIAPRMGLSPWIAAVGGAALIGYWLVAWLIGTTIEKYRGVHMEHHRSLGTVHDSEHTYFFPLNLRFSFDTLFGVRVLGVLRAREAQMKAQKRADHKPGLAPLAALAFHGGIVAGAYFLGFWWVSLAWAIGVGCVFPFFGALRQLLEHRHPDADPHTDYRQVNHGAYTRIFGDGAFSATFGGAGFNRHLLHHWEPQVSYTRLPDLEKFLLDTPLRPVIENRRSDYIETFRRLFSLG